MIAEIGVVVTHAHVHQEGWRQSAVVVETLDPTFNEVSITLGAGQTMLVQIQEV